MSATPGWRRTLTDVVDAIRNTLADGVFAGSMSAADFLKLAGLPSSAVPTARNVGTTAPLTGGGDLSADRTLSILAASGAAAGSMSAADFSKLAGLPSTAPPTSRAINTTAPLTGGGDLSADRTLAISAASGAAAGSMSAADFSKLAGLPSSAATIVRSALIDFTAAGTYTLLPNQATKYTCAFPGRLILTVATGAITTVPSGTSNQSWLAPGTFTFVTTGQFNNALGNLPGIISLNPNTVTTSAAPMLLSTDGTITIVTPAAGTGGFSLKGYYVFPVTYE